MQDGSPLVTEPDSDPTLIAPTIAAFPTPSASSQSAEPTQSHYRLVLIGAMILGAMLLGGAAVAFLYKMNEWDSSKNKTANITSGPSATRIAKPTPTLEPTPVRVPNISGEWKLTNTIDKTSYPAFANLRLGYHLIINQSGNEFTAEGEKVLENGTPMDSGERTPIHVNGFIDYNSVTATFVEEGLKRKTSGRFEWRLSRDGNQLRGTFISTAAKSSGSSVATRGQ